MKELEEFIHQATKDGHVRSGMILGIRMVLLGLKELQIEEPSGHHRKLIVIVETDRCLPDAVQLVAECRLANRSLKFKDFGKMAATFIDLKTDRSLRVAAREEANLHAVEMFGALERDDALGSAYRLLPDDQLFTMRWGKVRLLPEDVPGYSVPRVICAECKEGIAFRRELVVDGITYCRSCAGEHYLEAFSG
jgi:formylmethanofuran dehydrogenase subunit E